MNTITFPAFSPFIAQDKIRIAGLEQAIELPDTCFVDDYTVKDYCQVQFSISPVVDVRGERAIGISSMGVKVVNVQGSIVATIVCSKRGKAGYDSKEVSFGDKEKGWTYEGSPSFAPDGSLYVEELLIDFDAKYITIK